MTSGWRRRRYPRNRERWRRRCFARRWKVLPETPWPKKQGSDLRKFLIQTLQRHIEKKLVTAGMLEKISA